MKIPYFCCIGAELKRYAKDFDFMNQVYLYKVPTDDTIEEVLAQDYFQAISDTVLQDDLVYIYEASAETLHSCRFDKQNGHITAIPLASDETLTGAVTTIIHDNLTKNRAVISNNDGKIAVSEVTSTELGYLHGATSNIQTQLNNKASKDLDNLTSKGANIGNWSSNVTNCITEIPQDIKLELNNGTLTLKAGSKVYVPNGQGVFNVVTIQNDIVFSGNSRDKYFVFVKNQTTSDSMPIDFCFSGSTAPTVTTTYAIWYDTANNKIKWTGNNGATWTEGYSFPICICLNNTPGTVNISSIDQVFNGLGYIGSTVFTLPGVKGLIPNGRNTDGTLKNTTASLTSVQTTTFTNQTQTSSIRIGNNYLATGIFLYDEKTNYNYNATIAPGNERTQVNAGSVTTSSGTITSFNIKTAFHAVDYNDTEFIAHQAMPSDRYVDLTRGSSSPVSITAPADGYIVFEQEASSANSLIRASNTSSSAYDYVFAGGVGVYFGLTVPVSKGTATQLYFTPADTVVRFRFIYANGSK